MLKIKSLVCAMSALGLTLGGLSAATATEIGETPNQTHIEQSQIDRGELSLFEVIRHGQNLFANDFNTLDGHGDPERPGLNALGIATGFNRVSGPDSLACVACHSKPFVGGGGDNTAAIFPGFNRPDNVDALSFEGLNVKNSQSVFGGGPKQRLAEEMTAELQAIAAQAQEQAAAGGQPATLPLSAKGVPFGEITALPDGTLDTAAVEGVSKDLVIRPFNSVGAIVSLREFTIGAMEQHFGIEAEEQFGADGDGDGFTRELTVGDLTAAALFQAALPIPIQVLPNDPVRRQAAQRGRQVFDEIGCDGCHRPRMVLEDRIFRERAPGSALTNDLDLSRDGFAPRLRALPNGRGLVELYSDLKRHDMGPELAEPLLQVDRESTQHFLTLPLWGVASTGPWLHDGRATTLTEAILLHGGDAQDESDRFDQLASDRQMELIEFLKSLQIVVLDPRLLLPNLPLGDRSALDSATVDSSEFVLD